MKLQLASGRICYVTWIELTAWAANLLEGSREDASDRMRLTLPETLARSSFPSYIIDQAQPVFPPYQCLAAIRSTPITAHNHTSELLLAWFVHTLDLPVPVLVQQALDQIIWEQTAQDTTIDEI
ncbi:MAG TPA: hypothetical protein VD994_17380 [Prosthecobacter sp.]|nr:hypothetical protein [Prosthecobacter sp.]